MKVIIINAIKRAVRKAWGKARYLDKLRRRRKSDKNAFYIFMTPNHLNVGDMAIMESEKAFVSERFPDYDLVLFDTDESDAIDSLILRVIRPGDILAIHGGGFMGILWFGGEIILRKLLRIFAGKKIVILPQTVFFSDDAQGREELEKSRRIYESSRNLTLCVREKHSFQFMRERMPNVRTRLMPDMVLSYRYVPSADMRITDEGLIVLRDDIEKTADYRPDAERALRNLGMPWRYTDTIAYEEKKWYGVLSGYDTKRIVENKLAEFAKARVVITDRLHGMVFAALGNTPCVVLPSASHKIHGVYEWLERFPFVTYLDSVDRLEEAVRDVCAHDVRKSGGFTPIRDAFPEWFDQLEGILSDEKQV